MSFRPWNTALEAKSDLGSGKAIEELLRELQKHVPFALQE